MSLFARQQQKPEAVNKTKAKQPRKNDQAQQCNRKASKSNSIEVKTTQDRQTRQIIKKKIQEARFYTPTKYYGLSTATSTLEDPARNKSNYEEVSTLQQGGAIGQDHYANVHQGGVLN